VCGLRCCNTNDDRRRDWPSGGIKYINKWAIFIRGCYRKEVYKVKISRHLDDTTEIHPIIEYLTPYETYIFASPETAPLKIYVFPTYDVCTFSSSPFAACCAFSLAANCHAGIPGRLGKYGDPLLPDAEEGFSVPVKLAALRGSAAAPPDVVPFVLEALVFNPGVEADEDNGPPGVNDR
jgi:hypothetical protein